ncbi:MAG TPA: 2-hydroxy-3-oxopropionate reductase [Chitinophagaceae bacterium]|jgi:2-hydroxy-3-oxopropionate reductase|nr:2-hydroxy-3-oxopropionate reductase [Chitinophagaceae bacterium]
MEKIGFIGLGIMGRPMAKHLLKAGYPLFILSTSAASGELKAEGAALMENPKELAQQSDIIITMLPDSPQVESVMFGSEGLQQGMKQGSLFIDMSTIAPATSIKIFNELQGKNIEALDAPVSGGQTGAEAATLSIMVGGNEKAFQRALPVFEKMGKNITYIGKPGAGQTTKACNQIVVGMTIQAIAEALTLAKKSGVDVGKVRSALLGGFAQSKILDLHGQRIIDQNFKPGFKIKLHRKDMNIALQTGKDLSVPLPGSAIVACQMDAMLAQGNGELDHSALALFLESISGL